MLNRMVLMKTNKNPERDEEKECEYQGHRYCDPLGTFSNLEVLPIGKDRWMW